MTETNCDLFTHKSSRSYLNHLVHFAAGGKEVQNSITFAAVCFDHSSSLYVLPRTLIHYVIIDLGQMATKLLP
jgi:hypothetical protein